RCRCGRAQPPKGARECNGAVTAVATVERAHAHQVPCGEELAAAPIANDEREVAHEVGRALTSTFQVGAQDDLRVRGVRGKLEGVKQGIPIDQAGIGCDDDACDVVTGNRALGRCGEDRAGRCRRDGNVRTRCVDHGAGLRPRRLRRIEGAYGRDAVHSAPLPGHTMTPVQASTGRRSRTAIVARTKSSVGSRFASWRSFTPNTPVRIRGATPTVVSPVPVTWRTRSARIRAPSAVVSGATTTNSIGPMRPSTSESRVVFC